MGLAKFWFWPLRKECPYLELFKSVFSRIRTEYGDIRTLFTQWICFSWYYQQKGCVTITLIFAKYILSFIQEIWNSKKYTLRDFLDEARL